MPELPEVEVVRRDLEAGFVGRRIVKVAATNDRVLRHHRSRRQFVQLLTGETITRVDRHGKHLQVRLASGATLVVHLGMSGQLLAAVGAGRPRPPHTHVVMRFEDGDELRYVDPRTFGALLVVPPGGPDPLAHLGPDALTGLPAERFRTLLASRRVMLKALLMDQRAIAGIGNIYSDEMLFAAGVRYDRSSASLSAAEVSGLHGALGAILTDAVARRGSSLADAQYVDMTGTPGTYQHHHQVYAREGKPCSRCGGLIVRVKWGGRSTFLCESCQT